MKRKTIIKRQVSKTSIVLPHLVPINLIDNYMQKSLPWRAVIASVEVRFTQLEDVEYDGSHKQSTINPCAIDLDLPKLGMK